VLLHCRHVTCNDGMLRLTDNALETVLCSTHNPQQGQVPELSQAHVLTVSAALMMHVGAVVPNSRTCHSAQWPVIETVSLPAHTSVAAQHCSHSMQREGMKDWSVPVYRSLTQENRCLMSSCMAELVIIQWRCKGCAHCSCTYVCDLQSA
jgi:hypothetical protein